MVTVQKGDLILSREKSFTSWVVRFVTRCEWSHVGVCDGTGMFISAVPFDGVCVKLMSTVKQFAIYRCKNISDVQREGIYNFCISKLGDKYDFCQIIVLFWRIITDQLKTNSGDVCKDKYVCSELVAEACASQGIYFGKIVDNVIPKTIINSPLVERLE